MFSNRSESFIIRQMRPKKRNSFMTVLILGGIIIAFFFAYQAFGSNSPSEPSLKQIHVLFRHGEKTISSSYPNDPHKDYKWAEGPGELNNKGKLGLYVLGQTLRKKYDRFLGELYLANEISVVSSYASRCQMSAMTFLAGLFPPVGSQVWNEELLWQPIPVNPIPRSTDNLIAAKASCKAFTVEKKKSDEELHASLKKEDTELFQQLSEHSGLSISNIEQVETLYSILKIESENGLTLPAWTKTVYPQPMRRLAAMNLASYTRTPALKRLQGGPLLKHWLEDMQHGKKKSYFYSGHDLTIVNLMRTMGFEFPDFLPDYGAALILELHHSVDGDFVKALYFNGSLTTVGETLRLPGCKSVHCPLETLVYNVREVIPHDWAEECNAGS